METIPKPLFRRLVLTFLVGIGCLFTGIAFYFMENDLTFLYLSTLIFLGSVCKTVLLFLQIIHKSYTVIKGTCLSIHPLFFRNCSEIIIEDIDGNSLHLLLDKNQKLKPGMYYHIYFKSSSGIPPGSNPLVEKALLTDNLLGIELMKPPSTISINASQA